MILAGSVGWYGGPPKISKAFRIWGLRGFRQESSHPYRQYRQQGREGQHHGMDSEQGMARIRVLKVLENLGQPQPLSP